MPIISQDTFTRADNASSWGTASDGETWALTSGTVTLSIASNEGKVTGATGSDIMLLGAKTTADFEGLVRFSVSATGDLVGIVGRSGTSNARLEIAPSLNFMRLRVLGNVIGSTFPVSVSANTLYWLRFRAVGSLYSAKVWQSGAGEPDTWTGQWIDGSLQAAGQFGLFANCAASGDIIQFDSFSLDNAPRSPSQPLALGPKIVQRPFGGVLVKKGYRTRALSATIGTPRAKGYLLRGVQALLINGGQAESAYPNAVLSDNPVLYYRLNEGIGTTVTDFTGNGYDGTLSTGVTERQPGYSASDANTSMLLTGPASVTIPYTLEPYTWTSLSLEYLINISSGWQHIVTTIDASGNILHYLNGSRYNHLPPYLPRALSATLVNPPISSDPILVDLDMFYSGSYMAGDLDEIALYNYVLSPTQIATHYNASIVPAPITVTLAGVGTLAETFSLATALTDTLVGVATLTGTLSANTALTTTIPGVGTLTGTLTEATALTVTLSGVGTLSGTFSLATALSTTLAGVGTLSGTLSANLALAVEFDGVSTLTGTLGDSTALTCTLAGVGTLSGTLSTTAGVSLSVTMAGVGTLAGTLSANTALSTTLVGVGQLSGTTSLTTALSTTLAGVGTLTGTLSAKTALTSTLAGAGTLAGTMALSTALGCQLIGTGTLTGTMALRTALSLTFAGAGVLIASLTAQAPTIQFPTATWVTRDGKATWTTRDEQAAWDARDDLATWKAR